MLDEAIKSVKATLYERTTSPLFGAVLFAWMAWNYKFILVVFSELPVKVKIEFIHDDLYSNFWVSVVHLFGGPALTALVALVVYPWPAKWIYKFWRMRRKELADIRRTIEDETPLTIEQSREIRRKVIDIQSEYESEISRLNEEYSSLKAVVQRKDEELEKIKKENESNSLARNSKDESSASAKNSHVLRKKILSRPYLLIFNPEINPSRGSKNILFGNQGAILEGKNKNENSWRITEGFLELLQEDGAVHSRFYYQPLEDRFYHTNDSDTKSLPDQVLVPVEGYHMEEKQIK